MKLHQILINQTKKECVFCNPSKELVIERSKYFIIMFDPFALMPGHLLLTSKDHYGCLGEIPEEMHEECDELRKKWCSLLSIHFNTGVTRYEHGRAGHCIARGIESRSCHHYHEHLLPAELSLHVRLIDRFKSISYLEEIEIVNLYYKYHEYLLVSEFNGKKKFYIAKSDDVESHLLRTLSAEALGQSNLQNWESYNSCEKMFIGKDILKLATENILL